MDLYTGFSALVEKEGAAIPMPVLHCVQWIRKGGWNGSDQF
ncbi:hypothetical protein CLOSTMETH_00067 [[Clostridium] methylpentosum DSM 5476]|uniref:Uncharacterized protein n=1 Tax=[Clostridium] methylpentosum DSM 5476 TaxID=537013 RepID=C0E895_9FIRM|nr:hypothetical protein CLOSTMETH_00067 [[Clostridium] methylpentosum DSM 5476]